MARAETEVSFRIFEIDQLFVVPESPGVYVWMLRYQLPAKYPSSSTIESQVLNEMAELRSFLRQKEMNLASSSSYGVEWRGVLEIQEDENGVDRRLLGGETIIQSHIEHVNSFFASILPVLYVGKADNLKRRLTNHIGRLKTFEEFPFDEDDIEARDFAERVAERNVDLSYLRFTYFEYPHHDVVAMKKESLDSNEVAERHFNRALRPIFGKR